MPPSTLCSASRSCGGVRSKPALIGIVRIQVGNSATVTGTSPRGAGARCVRLGQYRVLPAASDNDQAGLGTPAVDKLGRARFWTGHDLGTPWGQPELRSATPGLTCGDAVHRLWTQTRTGHISAGWDAPRPSARPEPRRPARRHRRSAPARRAGPGAPSGAAGRRTAGLRGSSGPCSQVPTTRPWTAPSAAAAGPSPTPTSRSAKGAARGPRRPDRGGTRIRTAPAARASRSGRVITGPSARSFQAHLDVQQPGALRVDRHWRPRTHRAQHREAGTDAEHGRPRCDRVRHCPRRPQRRRARPRGRGPPSRRGR